MMYLTRSSTIGISGTKEVQFSNFGRAKILKNGGTTSLNCWTNIVESSMQSLGIPVDQGRGPTQNASKNFWAAIGRVQAPMELVDRTIPLRRFLMMITNLLGM